jgi:sensor histidine kinase YesM
MVVSVKLAVVVHQVKFVLVVVVVVLALKLGRQVLASFNEDFKHQKEVKSWVKGSMINEHLNLL